MRRIRDYMTIAEPAEWLGVSAGALRKWDRLAKVKAVRNPVNGYRLYRREDLEAFFRRLSQGGTRRQYSRRSRA